MLSSGVEQKYHSCSCTNPATCGTSGQKSHR